MFVVGTKRVISKGRTELVEGRRPKGNDESSANLFLLHGKWSENFKFGNSILKFGVWNFGSSEKRREARSVKW